MPTEADSSRLNYAGANADLLVAICQKLRTFIQENDALFVYSLICVLALFAPSGMLHGVSLGFVAAIFIARPKTRLTVAMCLGILVSSAHHYQYGRAQIPSRCFDVPIQATGFIDSFVELRQGVGDSAYLAFDLHIQRASPSECASGRRALASAAFNHETAPLKIGDRVTGQMQLRPLGSLWNPGNLPSNVGALANRTSARVSLGNIHSITHGPASLDALRYRLSQSIKRYAGQGDSERLLQGLLMGRQGALTNGDWLLLRELGIVHVLVVSGVHVSLVVLWIRWLLTLPRRFCVLPNDRGLSGAQVVVISLLTGGYVLLTGASLPAQRALLMMCTTLFMRVFLWRVSPLSSVCASAAILITINPWSALTSGFWLSILLTGILIIETERRVSGRVFQWLRLTLMLTFTSSLLSIFFFHQFSTVAFFSNLLVAPIFTVAVLPIGLLSLMMTEIASDLGGWLLSGVADVISKLIALVGAVNALSDNSGLKSVFVHPGIVFTILVIVGASLLRGKAAVMMILALLLLLTSSSHLNTATQVVITDVGQGTMVLLTSGDYALIYDTGGVGGAGSPIAEREVIPWLKSRGLYKVDLLVVSHGDLDHSGGLSAIREHFDVKQHWGYGGEPCVTGRELSPMRNLSVRVMTGTGQKRANTNADSCVLLVETYGRRILFSGDITSSTELELIASRSLPGKIDILIAAHHGSATSSSQSFIDKVDPLHTVFTTKRANRFNHPSNVVLQRFKASESIIWDTAIDGAVTFTVASGAGLSVRGMRTVNSPYWAKF